MSTPMQALITRARVRNAEQVDIRISPGGYIVMLARPSGHGGSAQARTHADAWLYVGRIRDQLDGGKPDVRGPAADRAFVRGESA